MVTVWSQTSGRTMGSSTTIFISYRRGDRSIQALTGPLSRELDKVFPGEVFRDSEGIDIGVDYREDLRQALRDCQVILVCIGDLDLWVRKGQPGATSLFDEGDWVRTEVAWGLQSPEDADKEYIVVPVLFGLDVRMPKPEQVPPELKDFSHSGDKIDRKS